MTFKDMILKHDYGKKFKQYTSSSLHIIQAKIE